MKRQKIIKSMYSCLVSAPTRFPDAVGDEVSEVVREPNILRDVKGRPKLRSILWS